MINSVFQRHGFALGIILLLTFITFSSCLKNDYVNWDDPTHFLESTAVSPLNAATLKTIFTETVNTTYIPLTTLSFALEYQVFKTNSMVSHVINIVLHLLVVALVYAICLKLELSRRATFIATLLFAIHPMRVESIAWVTERKDVLYGVFYLSAMWVYCSYLEKKQWSLYFATLLLGLFSMLAKPMALSLPLILLLVDWYKGRRDWVRMFLEKIPMFLYIYFLAGISVKENHDIFMLKEGVLKAVLTLIWSFSFYILKFVWPVTLTPFYPIPEPIQILQPQFFLSVLVFLSMIFLVIRFRTNRLIVFSILFFILSVFFLLRVNPDYLVVVDLVADRFMYLPSLGLCCLAGAYADKGLSKTHRVGLRNIFIMVLIVMASALMVKTFNQCRVWKDTLTLWKHILTHAPKTTFGYISRGTYYDEHNQLDLALADYDRAIELLPAYLKTYVRRGIVYGKRNQYDLALNDFNRVISVRPDDAIALSNRGNVYKLKGDCALAVEDYSRALQIDPNQLVSFYNRGDCYLSLNQFVPAEEDFSRVIAMTPRSGIAYLNRGIARLNLNKLDAALDDFNKSLLLNPNFAKTFFHRGIVYKMKGEGQKAAEDFQRADQLIKQKKG